ncbi:MAG TPA: phosphatase PAP2 family protein [Steroidobacteraceae bacterium]|nr:phosphatase PAP2 family protein [Steroidobacteraceae bacterium]HQX46913.1 phosphatase PAP2 family protein [Steroidobacteraceae bacterium]HQX78477.1 phosphatase PAP2 family protein [Steroidobacteraceae bacterium]HQZ79038.1 phosphatase PAP2 family protein [Steroidobacteraceae bacterium]
MLTRLIAISLLASLASACGTLPNGRAWGEDATATPGWRHVRDAAWQAARSPRVWVPLAAAALLQVDDWDREIADWAREETPLFGSVDNAARWSDNLRTASIVAFHVTALATPGGETPREWIPDKLRGYAVGAAAIVTTTSLTQGLKSAAGRRRPNGADEESFPSGHTAVAAVHDRLAAINLRSIDLHPEARRVLDAGLDAITIGTSWARIEAGWHYPSDTLVSASLGAFFASFYNEAFLGLDRPTAPAVALGVVPGGASLRVNWRF